MKITLSTLRELGTCSDYTRRFRDLFPESQYPEGVEITVETCVENARNFDWQWAAEVMFNHGGYTLWNQKIRESGDSYDNENRARAFGEIATERPDLFSDRLINAARTGEERADRELLRSIVLIEGNLTEYRRQAEYYANLVTDYEARLATAEANAPAARQRVAVIDLEKAKGVLASQEAAAEAAKSEVARLEALAAGEPEPGTSTDSAEPVTDGDATEPQAANA